MVTKVQVTCTDGDLGDEGNRELPLGRQKLRRTWDKR